MNIQNNYIYNIKTYAVASLRADLARIRVESSTGNGESSVKTIRDIRLYAELGKSTRPVTPYLHMVREQSAAPSALQPAIPMCPDIGYSF